MKKIKVPLTALLLTASVAVAIKVNANSANPPDCSTNPDGTGQLLNHIDAGCTATQVFCCYDLVNPSVIYSKPR